MNTSVLRLIDANANRAREGLRVLEDYERFILNDAALSSELKNLRHDLVTALKPLLAESILHRDTPSDVGREIKTESELSRADIASVVIAAGKRVGEALRSLEEFSKVPNPASAAQIEKLRYHASSRKVHKCPSLRVNHRIPLQTPLARGCRAGDPWRG
jgi:thiamine-phosphate pyrophosphorylase